MVDTCTKILPKPCAGVALALRILPVSRLGAKESWNSHSVPLPDVSLVNAYALLNGAATAMNMESASVAAKPDCLLQVRFAACGDDESVAD